MKRTAFAGLLAVVAMVCGFSVAHAQPHQTGIMGIVFDRDGQRPIPGAEVFAYLPDDPEPAGRAMSNHHGEYMIHDLAPGTYVVAARAPEFFEEWFREKEIRENADPVRVRRGEMTGHIDFTLTPREPQEPGGIIGMVVIQGTDQGLPNAEVMVFPPRGGRPIAEARTNEDGVFAVERIPPGEYQVRAGKVGFVPEWFREKAHRREADIVVVEPGRITEHIDFSLEPGHPGPFGAVAGRVVSEESGQPIPQARVLVFPVNSDRPISEAFTNDDGRYVARFVPEGRYHVLADAHRWRPEWFENAPLRREATEVPVRPEEVTEGINFTLEGCEQHDGGIAGVVFDASSEEPLPGAKVTAVRIGERPFRRETFTHDDGGYMLLPLPPGLYVVHASKPGFAGQAYPETLEVGSEIIEGIDFALEPVPVGGATGRVVDAETGEGIGHAMVTAIKRGEPPFHASVPTFEDGRYAFEVLPVGEYIFQAVAPEYLMQEFPEPVMIEEGQVTENINFALERVQFGTISGGVIDAETGEPIDGALITAHGMRRPIRLTARSGDGGRYVIERVPPGWYRLTCEAPRYFPSHFPDSVFVENGGHVEGINFRLERRPGPPDGFIAGRVINEESEEPIPAAFLTALGPLDRYGRPTVVRHAMSREDGSFLFERLPDVEFRIFAIAPEYQAEFYDDVLCYCDATPIVPDEDGVVIDLVPARDGIRSVGGVVTFADEPVEGAVVYAFTPDGYLAGSGISAFDGSYFIPDLPPGEYEVAIYNECDLSNQYGPVDVMEADDFDADIFFGLTGVDDPETILPATSEILGNFPNPFNPTTTIDYYLAGDGPVKVEVYNLTGRKVRTLVDEHQTVGRHSVVWDGKDAGGRTVSSGVYFYRLKTSDRVETRSMLMLK